MTDNTDNNANPTDEVLEVTKKLENTTLTTDSTAPTQNTEDTKPQNEEETKLDNDTNGAQTTNQTADNTVSAPPIQNQSQMQQTQVQNQNQTQTTQTNQTQQSTQGQDDDDLTNLIINYLPPTMSEGTLATLFSPYGLLERCKIVVDLQTLRSRGYGFVKYDNAVSAERALTALNGYELNGKKLKVAFARPQCKAITNANLYITNVPPHFSDNQLRKLFDDYGKIVECRVLLDQNGQSRGVGFVRMDTHHNAIQALQAMDQYVIDDKHPPLLVKLAQRRVPRRYWNSQNRQGQQGGGGGGGGNRGMGGGQGMGNKNKKKKRNSPGRKYYPKGNYGDNMGGQMGGNMGQNRQSPNKRGYYRPRQQGNRGGGNMSKNRGSNNNQGGGGGSGGGPPYFPAPMYQQQQEPYGMGAYGQAPQYAANLHMTGANVAMNNPNNPQNNIESPPQSYNVLVFNLPKHFNVDHIINMYAKFGPVQSVKIRERSSAYPKKGSVGVISYFYFDDARRAQNDTNKLEIGIDGDQRVLETMLQSPLK